LSFYTSTSKQVRDIHEEALRIKQTKATPPPQAASPPASTPVSPPPAESESSKPK